ncbi:MAG TPA: hypothetical protein VM571_10870 [Noviherbaspirillum sp.]|nr:hypothetical protein [Noviherbaspirillum sp.]
MSRFSALPQSLLRVLGLKGEALDRAALKRAAVLPRMLYVPLTPDPGKSKLMASDGYHPSAAGCRA